MAESRYDFIFNFPKNSLNLELFKCYTFFNYFQNTFHIYSSPNSLVLSNSFNVTAVDCERVF